MEVLEYRQDHIKEPWEGIYSCCRCGSPIRVFGSDLALCQFGIPIYNFHTGIRPAVAFKCCVCGMGNNVLDAPSYICKTIDGFINVSIGGNAIPYEEKVGVSRAQLKRKIK